MFHHFIRWVESRVNLVLSLIHQHVNSRRRTTERMSFNWPESTWGLSAVVEVEAAGLQRERLAAMHSLACMAAYSGQCTCFSLNDRAEHSVGSLKGDMVGAVVLVDVVEVV